MDRYWKLNAATTPPAVPDSNAGGYPQDGVPSSDIKDTVPGAWWYHSVTEEIRGAIAKLGGVPDWTKTDQLATAISNSIQSATSRITSDLAEPDGASLIGFEQNVPNAQQRAMLEKAREQKTVEDFEAGGLDDTVQLRNAIAWLCADSGRALSCARTSYVVSGSLAMNGAKDFVWDGRGATIAMAGGVPAAADSQMLFMTSCTSGLICNLTIDGNRGSRTPAEAPAHNIEVFNGCASLMFVRVQSVQAVCDGWYVGTSTPYDQTSVPTDIKLVHCGAKKAYRNNMSVINSIRFRDYFGVYTNATGTLPMAGIDFEPNHDDDCGNADALCVGTTCNDNAGTGFQATKPNTFLRLRDVTAEGNGLGAVGGAWGRLRIDGITLDRYTSSVTRGIIDCSSGSGETSIRKLRARNCNTGSDAKPVIFTHSTATGPISIDDIELVSSQTAAINATSRVTVTGVRADGDNAQYVFLVQGPSAAGSSVRGVSASGTKAIGYISSPDVVVGDVVANAPSASGVLLMFDTAATSAILDGYRIRQPAGVPAGQLAFRFNSAPRHVGSVIGLGHGTDFTSSTIGAFQGGTVGTNIGDITPYPFTKVMPINAQSIPANTSTLLFNGPFSGANPGDAVSASFSQSMSGLMLYAFVESTGIVKTYALNPLGSAVPLSAGNLSMRVLKKI
ncbi:hypothetical protein [Caballeronia insecticola]|uniref:Uncharacterized protein n=1 Tax=Caballeronia insecticola TaxID=758793 RepID=R4WVF0_9BURK|nr:hypothetical protein [Caballeronia insecticola]BAN25000.1 hypothetical protein BRPE64_BCDS03390 [Caballeronia insecticola]